ncbi:uncharacterized protein METZ01_LOCUS393981 [marine metagenome]|uniref:Uncharacterized protein n=1 Tax=marine metagenome TaxID=408172 RepID=A0A382V3V9_9ZZZZ
MNRTGIIAGNIKVGKQKRSGRDTRHWEKTVLPGSIIYRARKRVGF